MKKILTLVILIVMLLVTFSACVDMSGIQDQGNGSTTTTKPSNNSNLGNYNVVIESARLAHDFEYKPIIIVKYKFTNNDDDPTSFWVTFDAEAYQDGIGLNRCYFAEDNANYSEDNQTKEVQKGATLYVEVAYELNDTRTDVQIEVSESFSWSDKKVTKTFEIN